MIYMTQKSHSNWHIIRILKPEVINLNLLTTDFIMIYESTIFLHVLLISGRVYLTMLLMLTLSTCSKHAWTGSG